MSRHNAGYIGHTPGSTIGPCGVAVGMWQVQEASQHSQPNSLVAADWPFPALPPSWTSAKMYVSYDVNVNDLKNETVPTGSAPLIDQNTNTGQDDGKFGRGHAEYRSGDNTMYVLFASDFGADKTYEAWLRFDDSNADNGSAITISNFGSAGDKVFNIGDRIILKVNSVTTKLELVTTNAANAQTSIAVGDSFTKGTWKHVAIAVEGTIIRYYENGVQKGEGTAPTSYNNGFHVSTGNATFHIDDLLMSDIVRYEKGATFCVPDVHPTFDTVEPVITNVWDGTDTYREYVVTELFSLPPGATGYRFALSGDTLGGYTGRTMFCQNPAHDTNFHIGAGAPVNNPPTNTTLTSPSTSGTFSLGGTNTTRINFRKYNDVFYAWVFAPNGNGGNINISVRAIDANNNFVEHLHQSVGGESNTITGVIDEDG